LYFLRRVLEDAQDEIKFCSMNFFAAHEGHAFPTMGRNVMVVFNRCCFNLYAANSFVRGMSKKSDRNVGLTGMTIRSFMPFPFEDILVRLLHSNMLDTFKQQSCNGSFSNKLRCAIQESQLRTLELQGREFYFPDDFAWFVFSLQSAVLERLTLFGYSNRRQIPAVAMAIKQCPALTHFNLETCSLDAVHWGYMLKVFQKHKMLLSLTLKHVRWSNITYEEVALGFASLLKENTNIEKLEMESFFSKGQDSQILETRIMLQVEHNFLFETVSIITANGGC